MVQQMNPYDIIKSIFSNDGFSNELFSVKFDNLIDIKIEKTKNGDYQISFLDSKPTMTVKKYLTLSLKVSGILLKPNSGVFQIDYFPDIPFRYNWLFGNEESSQESSE